MDMSTDSRVADRSAGKIIQLAKRRQQQQQGGKQQFSSLILFLSIIIIVNLSPFQTDLELFQQQSEHGDETTGATNQHSTTIQQGKLESNCNQQDISWSSNADIMPNNDRHPAVVSAKQLDSGNYDYQHYFNSVFHLKKLQACFEFFGLMFTNPIKLGKRTTRSIQAEAKVLGKMAKMWYIKKKIKKLSKKLKKHTIAVPVFTAIPIYEHSYYPQPHVTHVTHGGGLHHAAAASSYSPAVTQAMAAAATASHPGAGQAGQQMATSASTNHQQLAAYSRLPNHYHHPHHQAMYNHPMHAASSQHQIINSYAPSPPLFVDDAGGLYGHYGNAYGRYDGGYQLW